MQQRKRPFRSRHRSKQHTSATGVAFVMVGLLIGVIGGLLAWQQVDALSSKGWTYVGMASQYQTSEDEDKRITVNVYACKKPTGYGSNTTQQFVIKAYATVIQNSTDGGYKDARLQVLAQDTTLKRYSASQPLSLPIADYPSIETPYTQTSFDPLDTLYFGYNTYTSTIANGPVSYATTSVSNLLSCQ